MNDFLSNDYELRLKGAVKKDLDLDNMLFSLNNAIKSLDHNIKVRKKFPLIFVLGMQRSGTTLLSQVVFNSFNFSVINNFIAKFWENPVLGALMYKSIYGDEQVQSNFSSFYGKTNKVHEPHEFSYFWHKHFLMHDLTNYDYMRARKSINWDTISSELQLIANISNKPLVLKGFDIFFHLKQFSESIPESFFIFIERDRIDNAVSLYNGRIQYFGDDKPWLGSYPTNYKEISTLEPKKQILSQIDSFNNLFKNSSREINKKQFVTLTYRELVESSNDSLKKIKSSLEEYYQSDFKLDSDTFNLKFSTFRGSKLYNEFLSL